MAPRIIGKGTLLKAFYVFNNCKAKSKGPDFYHIEQRKELDCIKYGVEMNASHFNH